MYFKGGSGITNPVDVNGVEIKKGDILTHSWFEGDHTKFFREHYPNMTKEEIEVEVMKPSVIVKFNEENKYFYAESINPDKYLYTHDFMFKYCKVIK